MPHHPQIAITIRTYAELTKFADAFAEGKLNLLILIGSAGLAKSQTIRNTVGKKVCWIEGNATAFGMYTDLFRHRDELVIIDDVDSLYSDRAAVRLLKSLCQTDPMKRVSWHSNAAGLSKEKIDREFETKSRVCIIANDWKNLDANTAAVRDRGHLVFFEPTREEIHAKAGEWFSHQHIYDWFGNHLHLVPNLSMRLYVRATELEAAGIDWVEHLLAEQPERSRIVAKLLADSQFENEEQRVGEFGRQTGASRATYYNWKKKLRRAA